MDEPIAPPNLYLVTPEGIRDDLTIDLPQWILSSYAPGRNPPDQLFGGYPREQSFEELQLLYREGVASGNEQLVVGGCLFFPRFKLVEVPIVALR